MIEFPHHPPVATSSPTLRAAIHEAFRGRCFWSGRDVTLDAMHVDHVVPRDHGGPDSPYNYVLACPDSNRQKSDLVEPEAVAGPLYVVRTTYAPRVIALMNGRVAPDRPRRPKGTHINISAWRAEMGWTQAELGQRLDPPVSQHTVSRWESGERRIPAGLAQALMWLKGNAAGRTAL